MLRLRHILLMIGEYNLQLVSEFIPIIAVYDRKTLAKMDSSNGGMCDVLPIILQRLPVSL